MLKQPIETKTRRSAGACPHRHFCRRADREGTRVRHGRDEGVASVGGGKDAGGDCCAGAGGVSHEGMVTISVLTQKRWLLATITRLQETQ